MAEEDVAYASVTFKEKQQPQVKFQKEEETVYDDVKVRRKTEESDSKGLLSEEEVKRKRRYNLMLGCCLGMLCIILVLGIVGVIVYLVLFHSNELNKLKPCEVEHNNLTAFTNELRSDKLNLTKQMVKLTRVCNVVENLTAENQELKTKNQELTEEKKSLKEQIQNMENMETELNVSRAQWSINEYCRKVNNDQKCKPCQEGWLEFLSSCFAYNNANKDNQRTWEKAQEHCREKHSNLTAAATEEERNHIISISHDGKDIQGYWIGLRAEQGKWKWIDGTELTNQSWIGKTAADGQCVTSLKGKGWQSVSCEEKNAWICEKKTFSVN